MIAHRNIDYTIYLDENEFNFLQTGKPIVGELQDCGTKAPITILLKTSDEIYDFYKKKHAAYMTARKSGKNLDWVIFENETQYALVYWKGTRHILYFQTEWFVRTINGMLEGSFGSRTVRWGSDKISLLAGKGSEAERFKLIWG